MTITGAQTAEGVARMSAHNHGTSLEIVVNDVYAGMKALEPVPVDPANIIFAPIQDDASFEPPWHAKSANPGCSIIAVTPSSVGIPKLASDYVMRAMLSGSGPGYARAHFQHDDAGVPRWGEGTDIWYAASFWLPTGFYSRKTTTNDIMRWDAYVDGSNDMQGGLGIGTDRALYIMSNYPYTRPLETEYEILEGAWTRIEVHQKISEFSSVALNEIYANGALVGMSSTPNYKGSAYPAAERAINRLRVGLVSEGSVPDSNTLFFDKFVISKVRVP